jgi:thioredoxin reductase/bacterioferritin-associated ferredoxin
MTEQRVELAIVGAGPAGLEAAITAADAGVEVSLIEAYSRPGGQYYKQLPASFQGVGDTVHQAESRTIFHRLEAAKIQMLANTVVWGAFPGATGEAWLLALHGSGAPHRMRAKAVILATGAWDRPVSFPGWTLPGVMTAGAAQNLLKNQRVLPGRRVLLSGTGPLQWAVAAQLSQAGADVAAVLEGASLTKRLGVRHTLAMWRQVERLREGWGYWRTLRRAGVPLKFGWAVIEARGDDEVEEVDIARLNDRWQPILDSRQTIPVDTLLIGYGFVPAIELGRLLGCQQDYEPRRGGYVPRRDRHMQTSLPGVYAVGDGAGVGGAKLAQVEGHIAGLAAARQLGRLDQSIAQNLLASQRPALIREQRFARMLGDLFTPGPGLYTLATDDTLICRCEEVSLAEIRQAVATGARTVTEIKGLTRAGMGNCQGRLCGELVARAIVNECNTPGELSKCIEAAGFFTARSPIHPLPLSALAEAVDAA